VKICEGSGFSEIEVVYILAVAVTGHAMGLANSNNNVMIGWDKPHQI
jgi:hypothetical protein